MELMQEVLFFIRQQALDLLDFRFEGRHGGVMIEEVLRGCTLIKF
jgi:hypothetical protein